MHHYVLRRNNMRVVGGIYRHRILEWPDDTSHIRPTKDRIRESIFSALGPIDNLKSLDLYSGSGAIGIESLSRGCSFCTFVDCNKTAINTIKKNISNLNITNARVIMKKDDDAIKDFIENQEIFDIVFIDPPYKEGRYEELLDTFLNNNLISRKGIFVIECDREINIKDELFTKRKDYQYGEVKVIILWR